MPRSGGGFRIDVKARKLQWERRSPGSPSPFFTVVLAFERRSADIDRPTSTC